MDRGLEKLHRHRGIHRAIDFSATPMFPGVFKDRAWRPFQWIISDFALVDAIESGLVKVPRTPTDDNTGEAIPKYRNLWQHIKDTLPKRTEADDDSHPLTDYLAEADGPLKQLAGAWEETYQEWQKAGRSVPPAMIVICHDTTVARLLERHIAELGEASPLLVNQQGVPPVTVRIDSEVLEKAEAGEGGAAEELRELVSTVGKPGQPGEKVRALSVWPCSPKGGTPGTSPTSLGSGPSPPNCSASRWSDAACGDPTMATCHRRSTWTSTGCRSSCCRWPRPRGTHHRRRPTTRPSTR